MKKILLFVILITGCRQSQEERQAEARSVIKSRLACDVYVNNCFCVIASGGGTGSATVYSPTWAPMEVCDELRRSRQQSQGD